MMQARTEWSETVEYGTSRLTLSRQSTDFISTLPPAVSFEEKPCIVDASSTRRSRTLSQTRALCLGTIWRNASILTCKPRVHAMQLPGKYDSSPPL